MRTEHRSRFETLLLIILLFFFIYAPRINAGVVLNTSILALLLLCAFNFRALIKAVGNPAIQIVCVFFGFLCFYNLFVALVNKNNPIYFSQITLSVISYTFFGFIIAKRYFNREGLVYFKLLSFLKLALTCIFINTIIILLEYIIPSFKQVVERILFNDFSNADLLTYADHPFWIRGLASAGGAGQSIFGALGILIITLLRRENSISFIKSFLYSTCILVSLIFIGRSGLILGIVYYFIYIINTLWSLGQKSTLFKFQAAGFFGLIFGAVYFIFQFLEFDQEHLNWAFEWLDFSGRGGIKDTGSTDELKGYLFLPGNIFDGLFGIGFFEGTNKVYPRSDSGYIKSIFSIGIPLSIIMYSLIFYLVSKIRMGRHNFNLFIMIITLSLLITEIKEPIIYQNFVGRFLFAFIGFAFASISADRLTKMKQQIVN